MSDAEFDVAPREWTRVHWVSPIISGGQAIVVLVGVIAFQSGGGLSEAFEDIPEWLSWLPWVALLGLISFIAGVSALQWRVDQYRISDDAVEQRKGVLFKQQRQARLDRLQAVDVVQPFVARIFGFAELKIEVAGGKESGVRLRYVKLEHAEAMRNEILDLAAGRRAGRATASDRHDAAVSSADGPAATDDAIAGISPFARAGRSAAIKAKAAPEREVYKVRPGRLIGSIVLSWPVVAAVVLPVIIGGGILSFSDELGLVFNEEDVAAQIGATFASGIWGFLAILAVLWAQLNSGFNFAAGIAGDGIRLKHGLLDTRRQTVPPGRVQALRLKQSLLWRKFDWWKVTLNVAGYQDDQVAVSTLLPVGKRAEALFALWLVLPDLGDPDPAGTISAAMSGKGSENGFTASPSRSMVFDLLQWRHRGVRATDRALLIREGLLVREVFVVPHERTQSLAIRQGPLQRLLRLADIEVHSTNGPVRPVARHLDVDDAIRFVEAQAQRARENRARQTPEQWAAAVGAEA